MRGEIALPVVRFGFGEVLDDGVAFAQKGEHVTAEEDRFGEWAEEGKGSSDAEVVSHLGCAGGERAEVVIGLHGAKDAFGHCGLKICGRLHGGVFAGEVLPDGEVLGAPGDLLVEFGETGGDAADGQGCSPEWMLAKR